MEKWVAEFFLYHQQNPRVYATTTLFSGLKLVNSDDCVKLKITAVLRDISNSLIQGMVDEGMLDLLEILEKLLLQEHWVIMGSLKSAYCWTAVECSIRFMWPVNAFDGFFGDALERIWTKRIGILKERESDLVTRELLKWENDLKKAFEEPEMYQKIRETNIRYIAISHLSQLLKDHWSLLGCSSLELEARKWLLKHKDPNTSRIRAGDAIDNINREKANGIDKQNEQDEELEPILNMGDIRVAKELKDCLMEIQELIHHSSKQSQEHNVPSQADSENRTEKVGAEDQTSSSSSGRIRSHLPSREPLNVSPLKKMRLANKPHPRRRMKFWTPEEIEALREGVKEYGKSWKYIKESNPVVLADRTEVDLKDKWRNLTGREK